MDIAELWPLLGILGGPVAVAYICWRFCFRWRGLPRFAPASWVIRLGSGFAGFAACAYFCLALLAQGCVRYESGVPSPRNRFVAVRRVSLLGFLDDDWATVRVRKSWRPVGTLVFWGNGGWNEARGIYSPDLHWIDDRHLIIRYYKDRLARDYCLPRAGEVEIACDVIKP